MSKLNQDLLDSIIQLDFDEFEEVKELYYKTKQRASFTPSGEIDTILAKYKINMTCPNCQSSIIVKNSKRNGVQRFKCTECGKNFTRLTGTFAEKTQWYWDIYIEFIGYLLTNRNQDDIFMLMKEKLEDLAETTVFYNSIKIMDATTKYPRSKLNGVVQIDETHFHESQKASRLLEDPMRANKKRKPRRGARPSKYGVMGPEFATVCTAVDEYNHVDVGTVCYGKIDINNVSELCERVLGDVIFLCTDKNLVYQEFTKDKSFPHYTVPSDIRNIVKSNYSKHTKEWLYNNGMIDSIQNYGRLSYSQFCKVKKENGLNLSRVNGLHAELKKLVNRIHKGVSSKYLDYYVGFFTFKKNFITDNPHRRAFNKSDCEYILKELLTVRNVITVNEIKSLTRKKEKSSPRYVNEMVKHTNHARDISKNDKLKFNEEDGIHSFNKRTWIDNQPTYKLRIMIKLLGLKGYSNMPSAKMKAILRTNAEFQEILDKYLAYDIGDSLEEEDKQWVEVLPFVKKQKP